MQLIFASTNIDKIREVKKLLPDHDVLSLLDFPEIEDVEETGATLAENASLKSTTIAKQLNYQYPVIADDSGFFVDALDGAPGVHSARWTGTHRDYETQNQKILELLKGQTNRNAHYKTVISYVDTTGHEYFFIGTMDLKVAQEESTQPGFSYDTIVTYKGQYVSEMPLEQKNELSARGQALQHFVDHITKEPDNGLSL